MRLTATVIFGLLASYPLAAATSTASFAQAKVQTSAAEKDFRNWMETLKRNGVEAKAASVAFDPSADTLAVKELILTSAPAGEAEAAASQLRVGSLSMRSFASAEDGYRFSSLTADDISTASSADGAAGLSVRHIVVGKTFLPSLAGFTADPTKPVTSQIKLLSLVSKLTTDSVEVSEVSTGPDLQIKKMDLGAIGSGTIASLTATGITAKALQAGEAGVLDAPVGDISIDEASVSKISVGAYIQLFDESAYLSAGAARPWSDLVGSAALKGVTVKNGAVSFAVQSADLDALKVRQFPENITSIFDAAASDPAYLQNNPSDAQKLANSVRQSVMLTAARLSGFKLTAPNRDGNALVSVGGAELANLSANHIDQVQMSNAGISDPGGAVSLRSLRLNDIALPSTPSTLPPAETSAAAVKLPTIGNVAAEGLDVSVGDMKFGLNNLQVAMSYFIGSTPTNVKAAIDHLKFSVAQITNPGLKQTLVDLGYQDVDLSAELSGAWQDSVSALAFDAIKVTGASMGTLTLSGSLTGVTREGMADPRGRMGAEIMAGGLQNFRLSFENDSLFDRFITQAAKVNNKTPEDFKKLLSSNMPAIMAKISSPAIRNKFIFAGVSFLNTPSNLDFVASTSDVTPVEDVLAALQNPADLPVVLKLDASANDRK